LGEGFFGEKLIVMCKNVVRENTLGWVMVSQGRVGYIKTGVYRRRIPKIEKGTQRTDGLVWCRRTSVWGKKRITNPYQRWES